MGESIADLLGMNLMTSIGQRNKIFITMYKILSFVINSVHSEGF
jgi:hypothetical protein